MRAGRIGGAALDVYPNEPASNGNFFTNDLNPWTEDLRGLKNIILTPHIGGSTEGTIILIIDLSPHSHMHFYKKTPRRIKIY